MTEIIPSVPGILSQKPNSHTVVILGASKKPERYANMAQRELMARGYRIIPVHPKLQEVEGLPVTTSLNAITESVHTLTMYVGPARAQELVDDILRMKPQRVIFNPGTEFPILEERLQQLSIETVQGCTLVMLRTGQF